jgi:hypothetical protein
MDPHHAEYLGAVAAMNDTYQFQPGDIVQVEEPFTARQVKAIVQHAHGDVVLVVTERGESLEYDRDECNRNF